MNALIVPPSIVTEPSSRLYLWKQRTFYIGPLAEPICFSQGAASFAVSLGGSIKFSSKDLTTGVSCQSILIPPGTEIECDLGTAPVAVCMLDALCCDYTGLLSLMENRVGNIAYGIKQESNYIKTFTQHYHHELAPEEIYLCLEKLISLHQKNNTHIIDSRIAKVIELIQKNIENNISNILGVFTILEILKEQKKKLQIQIYGKGKHGYELNCYIQ